MPLKLISLNIEGHKHLDKFLPFLEKEQPDVVCLQEVFGQDIEYISRTLGMTSVFVPLVRYIATSKPDDSFYQQSMSGHIAETSCKNGKKSFSIKTDIPFCEGYTKINVYGIAPRGEWGIAILFRTSVSRVDHCKYKGDPNQIPVFIDKQPNSVDRALLWIELKHENAFYRVITTHFTWSPDGKPNPDQERDFAKLVQKLSEFDEIIFVGDLNVPRGGVFYSKLSELYQDMIPSGEKTSLDQSLHYAGNSIEVMVDGLFLSQRYEASDVRLQSGVSDHKAVVATIFSQIR